MLWHLWHSAILATLLLGLEILVVHLLLIAVVAWIDLTRASRDTRLLRGHSVDILWGLGNCGFIDTIVRLRFRCVQASLNEILAFGLGDQRLKLWSREGVNQTGLRDDEQENLSASQDRELIGLLHDPSLSLGECDVATRLVGNEFDLNLASLATTLLIIVVIIVSGCGHARTFGATGVKTIAAGKRVITWRRVIDGVGIGDVGHAGRNAMRFAIVVEQRVN